MSYAEIQKGTKHLAGSDILYENGAKKKKERKKTTTTTTTTTTAAAAKPANSFLYNIPFIVKRAILL